MNVISLVDKFHHLQVNLKTSFHDGCNWTTLRGMLQFVYLFIVLNISSFVRVAVPAFAFLFELH